KRSQDRELCLEGHGVAAGGFHGGYSGGGDQPRPGDDPLSHRRAPAVRNDGRIRGELSSLREDHRMRSLKLAALAVTLVASPTSAQTPTPSANLQQFVAVTAPTIALNHVRVVDGTGAPAAE